MPPVVAVTLGQVALQGGAVGGKPGIGAEAIAEGQLVVKSRGAGRDEVQMMGAASRIRLAEPVHLIGQVRRVEVAEAGGRCEADAGALKVADTGQDVDDRLGFQARHGGAADVVNAAIDPLPDPLPDCGPLKLETTPPSRV